MQFPYLLKHCYSYYYLFHFTLSYASCIVIVNNSYLRYSCIPWLSGRTGKTDSANLPEGGTGENPGRKGPVKNPVLPVRPESKDEIKLCHSIRGCICLSKTPCACNAFYLYSYYYTTTLWSETVLFPLSTKGVPPLPSN